MTIVPLTLPDLRRALGEGWALAGATRGVSMAYAAIFVLGGGLIIGGLLANGLTPFVIAAAGAFMLFGPAILAGFFGIAAAHEAGRKPGLAAIAAGYRAAAPVLWVLALVCALLLMIFVTDAAILYSYQIGGTPVGFGDLLPASAGIVRFVQWAMVSGLFVAFMLYSVSAFAVPLLCERRSGLVGAVVSSVRVVFGSFRVAMLWALLLSTVIIGSILLLPLLPLTLPWLAYASRALYRRALPND